MAASITYYFVSPALPVSAVVLGIACVSCSALGVEHQLGRSDRGCMCHKGGKRDWQPLRNCDKYHTKPADPSRECKTHESRNGTPLAAKRRVTKGMRPTSVCDREGFTTGERSVSYVGAFKMLAEPLPQCSAEDGGGGCG